MPGRTRTSIGLFGVLGLLLGVAIVAVGLSLTLSGVPSTSTTTTTATTPGGPTTTSPPSALQFAERAACTADARSVAVAVAAYQASTTTKALPSSAAWRSALVGTYIQTWPTSSLYRIAVAGHSRLRDGVERLDGDVLVSIVASGLTYDASSDPTGACATL